MKTRLLLSTIFILFLSIAHSQNWAYYTTDTSGSGAVSTSIEVSSSGDVYSIGGYSGTVDFDPGPGTCNYSSSGNNAFYISKVNDGGNFVWAKSIVNNGTNNYVEGHDLQTDDHGNIYITGYYHYYNGYKVDFDPGPGTCYLTASNIHIYGSVYYYGLFALKLDSAGNFIWAKNINGDINPSYGMYDYPKIAIAIASNSPSLYLSVNFKGTVDFNPGSGINNLTSASSTDADVAIIKLDTGGNFIWAINGGTYSSYDILVDASENIYWRGGTSGMVLSTFDSSGTSIWTQTISGVGTFDMCLTPSGNIYATGSFSGSVDFDPGMGTYTLSSINSVPFILKLDHSGNFKWAMTFADNNVNPRAIASDVSGNVYMTGHYWNTPDMDPGTGTAYLSSSGHYFISKLDSTGGFIWAKTIDGTSGSYAEGNSILTNAYGNIYVGGYFTGTVDFDPGTGTNSVSSTAGSDAFVLKLDNAGTLPISLLNFDVTKQNNNAVLNWKTAWETNVSSYSIERSMDAKEFTPIGAVAAAGNSSTIHAYQFTDKDAGIHFKSTPVYYRFKQLDMDGKFTYSPIRSLMFDRSGNMISIYPNPTENKITLEVETSLIGSDYSVFNQTGVAVIMGKISSTTTFIYLNDLPKGLYLVRINDNSNPIKIIKQ